ncbi:MAG: transketolase C-terminal domain-containing protein, partial [Turicibacter sp.]|nr:transketolase C-terminal domain-containing protein [Turicibacter sp.]
KYQKVIDGNKVAILALGSFYQLGASLHKQLKNETGIEATLINPRFASGLDEELLTELLTNHEIVVTLEDGILDGGFGEKISRFYSDKSMNVLNYGATKEFTDRVNLNELYERYRLREDLMIEDIKKLLK